MENGGQFASSKSLDIEAHPTELAIIVKYGARKEQKVIYLKDLTPNVDSAVVTRFVLDKCPIIPLSRAVDVEQIIHYLQRRSAGHAEYTTVKTTTNLAAIKASMEELDSYIEMLYEDSEKTKGTAHILYLSNSKQNLQFLVENEVLMSAVTRVFREDSKKNFELATNIAVVFLKFSEYRQFQPMISHYKIGTLAMQLIENELKRWDIWRNEAKISTDKAKKKWEFAITRQDELISVLLQILINLADDLKTELKMVKRGILPTLIKCLDHSTSNMQISTVTFLWKLSVFAENKEVMAAHNIVDKLVGMFPTGSTSLMKCLHSLLFNLSFDIKLKNKMVVSGLVPFIAPSIEHDHTALCLLYQLSTVDDAKAMITFTDAISILMKLVSTSPDKLVVKGLLINAALEKRNAQLICSTDGRGLTSLIEAAFDKFDVMLMKICRNIASHDGTTQDLFQKHLRRLVKYVLENRDPKSMFAVECLATVAQIATTEWSKIATEMDLIPWIESRLHTSNNPSILDDCLLQVVVLIGSMAQDSTTALMLVPVVPSMSKLIDHRQEDEEIVLQIVYAFYCLLTHQNINQTLCAEDGAFVEALIRLMHDPNQQLRNMCDQALQFIAESNVYWRKRVVEERFRFHNSQWIEMVNGTTEQLSDDEDSLEDMNNVVLGADELLEEHDL